MCAVARTLWAQVSCFGDDHHSDQGDHWKVEVEGGLWGRDGVVRFKHQETGEGRGLRAGLGRRAELEGGQLRERDGVVRFKQQGHRWRVVGAVGRAEAAGHSRLRRCGGGSHRCCPAHGIAWQVLALQRMRAAVLPPAEQGGLFATLCTWLLQVPTWPATASSTSGRSRGTPRSLPPSTACTMASGGRPRESTSRSRRARATELGRERARGEMRLGRTGQGGRHSGGTFHCTASILVTLATAVSCNCCSLQQRGRGRRPCPWRRPILAHER